MLDSNQIVNQKSKRVLWLCNHNTLMDFEVPLLISLGFEVFVPKVLPSDMENHSAKINYTYDQSLTITKEELDTLNKFNFYEDKYNSYISNIINSNFNTCFVVIIEHMFKSILARFDGVILLRVFGVAKPVTYSEIIDIHLRMKELVAEHPRLFLAESYEFLHEVEEPYLAKKAVFLPLGMKNEVKKFNNQSVNKLLFVCPRLHQHYYKIIYQKFDLHFKDIESTIAGKNTKNYESDSRVVGHLEDEQYYELYRTHKVMFYHSDEPRHLHYHPLEAIMYEMPLIFIKEGLLSRMVDMELPGAASSWDDARKKVLMIMNGNTEFIKSVLTSQKLILNKFSFEYCFKSWQQNLLPVISKKYETPLIKKNKLAVILSYPYLGGVLTGAKNIAKMLKKGSNSNIDVIFAYPNSELYFEDMFSDLKELNIKTRPFRWQEISAVEATNIIKISNRQIELPITSTGKYCIPEDDISSLSDVTHWLFISDRMPLEILPLKPFSILAYDYLQRFFTLFPNAINNVIINNSRAAQMIFTTTTQSRHDAITYLGMSEEKVGVLPMEYSIYDEALKIDTNRSKESNYFIWITNLSEHKNHVIIAKSLTYYYNNLSGKLNIKISGHNSNLLDPKIDLDSSEEYKNLASIPHIKKSRSILKECSTYNKVKFLGYTSEQEYSNMLKNSKFALHGNSYDNGSFVLVEAAYYGVPSIATRYPATEYMNQRFNLNLLFCDSTDYKDIAHKIKDMELNHQSYRQSLPSREYLEQFSWQNLAQEYYETIMDYLML